MNPIVNIIYGNLSSKNVINQIVASDVKILKYKTLYNNNDFNNNFNKWYREDLKYVMIKMNNNKIHKIQAMIKSLIADSFIYLKNDNMIEVIPKLKFIIISEKPLLMDNSMNARTTKIYI